MLLVNLIPTSRKQALARACRCRHWSAGLLLYVGALAATYIVAHQVVGDKSVALAASETKIDDEISGAGRLKDVLGRSIASAQWQLETARFIGRHPDWSVLLTVVARQLGEDVVLSNMALTPVKAGGEPAPGGKVKPRGDAEIILVEVAGMAQSQPAVSAFILRLEKTGVFDKVRLLGTQRQPFLTGSAVTFRLECTLEGRGGKGS